MVDRIYVEKAADAGFGKINLLRDDPLRYMLRAIGAGMGLTLVVFVFWVLKQNLHDTSLGPVIASGFFWRRIDDHRLHQYRAIYQ